MSHANLIETTVSTYQSKDFHYLLGIIDTSHPQYSTLESFLSSRESIICDIVCKVQVASDCDPKFLEVINFEIEDCSAELFALLKSHFEPKIQQSAQSTRFDCNFETLMADSEDDTLTLQAPELRQFLESTPHLSIGFESQNLEFNKDNEIGEKGLGYIKDCLEKQYPAHLIANKIQGLTMENKPDTAIELDQLPINQNLFNSILAELNFRKHQNKTNITYHHSDWGVDLGNDVETWWLSIENIDSKWMIRLYENDELMDSWTCPFEDQNISWDAKNDLQEQLETWLAQNAKKVLPAPEIWWAISIGNTKNSEYLFALQNAVVGIGFHLLSKKKIGADFVLTDAISWKTFEGYCKNRFDDEQRPTLAKNQSMAFLSRIRSGDRVVALKGKSPIGVGRFSDQDIDSIQKHEKNQNQIQQVFRSVKWEPFIGRISLDQYDDLDGKEIEQELKTSCAEFLENCVDSNLPLFEKANGHGLFTQKSDASFSLSYTFNDARKTQYCDYIEQRASVLDPTSRHLLTYLQKQKPLWTDTVEFSHATTMDMRETLLVKRPAVYQTLLMDRTRSMDGKKHNIIWASEGKEAEGSYLATDEVSLKDIQQGIIIPRCLKNRMVQKERTKGNAEVFTPLWIVKKQNDQLDEAIDNLEEYTKRTWLEITCGEAPYIVSRYDMETGETIPLEERQGFLDRKLRRINEEIHDFCDWQWHVEWAFKASYGFEWNGDSLLLARENLLGTYLDYFVEKWHALPINSFIDTIVEIISYNLFQMDGLTRNIPLLSKSNAEKKPTQLSLFNEIVEEPVENIPLEEPIPVLVKNWKTNQMEPFD